MKTTTYSLVIPVMNEKENVAPLHAEIVETMDELCDGNRERYQVIFIDDGSNDGTVDVLHTLSPITVIEFRKNFGQTSAMDAGIKHATGDLIITLDGDGQNPPSEIPKLLEELERGNYDVVSGWRKNRKDTASKKFVSRGANVLRGFFVKDEIHDSGCSLKVFKRECFQDVDLFGEMHRFIPAILRWSGFRIGEVIVEHRPRTAGVTKYNWQRILKSLIDMISIWFWRKYATRPLHLFGGVGVILMTVGGVLGTVLAIRKLFFNVSLGNSNLPLLAVLLVLVGVQLFISGLLTDVVMKQYYTGDRNPYRIREITKQ